jgi:hypothetical protein
MEKKKNTLSSISYKKSDSDISTSKDEEISISLYNIPSFENNSKSII